MKSALLTILLFNFLVDWLNFSSPKNTVSPTTSKEKLVSPTLTIPRRNQVFVSDENQQTATATAETTLETTTSEFESISSTDSFKPIPTGKLTTSRKKIDENRKFEIYRPTIKTIAQTKPILTTPENSVRNSISSPSIKPSPGLKFKYLKILWT